VQVAHQEALGVLEREWNEARQTAVALRNELSEQKALVRTLSEQLDQQRALVELRHELLVEATANADQLQRLVDSEWQSAALVVAGLENEKERCEGTLVASFSSFLVSLGSPYLLCQCRAEEGAG